MSWTTPRTWVDDEVNSASQFNTHIRDNMTYLYEAMPSRAFMRHFQARVQSGGSFVVSYANQDMGAPRTRQTGSSPGDNWTQEFVLQAGTYTFGARCYKDSSSGIMDIEIDGAAIGSIDLYGAGADDTEEIANVEIGDNGLHTLSVSVDTQNASSSGYRAWLYVYWLAPEGGN